MEKRTLGRVAACIAVALFFFTIVLECHAWARAGGGGSSGSRGSRSFSSPSMPSRPSPSSPGTPGSSPDFSSPRGPVNPSAGSPSALGGLGRSPFMQGLAGGLAGGLLGSMLFGGSGHAAPAGAQSGGGIGLLDIILIGLLAYFAWKFFMKRRREASHATAYYGDAGGGESERPTIASRIEPAYEPDRRGVSYGGAGGIDGGLDLIARSDPSFNLEKFKETVQDM
jgi:predicted lipid-binding transport protein (Tim44 family)